MLWIEYVYEHQLIKLLSEYFKLNMCACDIFSVLKLTENAKNICQQAYWVIKKHDEISKSMEMTRMFVPDDRDDFVESEGVSWYKRGRWTINGCRCWLYNRMGSFKNVRWTLKDVTRLLNQTSPFYYMNDEFIIIWWPENTDLTQFEFNFYLTDYFCGCFSFWIANVFASGNRWCDIVSYQFEVGGYFF